MGKHKVPQGYSPAEENAGSHTPFGMTFSKRDILHYAINYGSGGAVLKEGNEVQFHHSQRFSHPYRICK